MRCPLLLRFRRYDIKADAYTQITEQKKTGGGQGTDLAAHDETLTEMIGQLSLCRICSMNEGENDDIINDCHPEVTCVIIVKMIQYVSFLVL